MAETTVNPGNSICINNRDYYLQSEKSLKALQFLEAK